MNRILAWVTALSSVCFNLSAEAQWLVSYSAPGGQGIGWAMDACDSMNAVAASSGPNQLLVTTDGGTSWTEKPVPFYMATDISMTDAAHFWIVTGEGREIYATSDSGESWTEEYSDTGSTMFMNYIQMFDSKNGIAMGDPATGMPTLWLRTSDGGMRWSRTSTSLIGAWSGDLWRRMSFVSPDIGYFFESGLNPQRLLKTTDGGVSWTETGFTGYMQVLKFYDEQIGLAYNSMDTATKVYRTLDGGTTWEHFAISATGWGNDIEFVPGNPARVWLTDYDKLFFSSDTGRTWQEQTIKTASLKARDIVCPDARHGWILCDDGVIYRTEHADEVIVSVKGGRRPPGTLQLSQNYPNPFNPSTVISYRLSAVSEVTVKVYDILGRAVETLVNGMQDAGSHSITFDGSGLASGVYFYRLQTPDYTQTMKMILLK